MVRDAVTSLTPSPVVVVVAAAVDDDDQCISDVKAPIRPSCRLSSPGDAAAPYARRHLYYTTITKTTRLCCSPASDLSGSFVLKVCKLLPLIKTVRGVTGMLGAMRSFAKVEDSDAPIKRACVCDGAWRKRCCRDGLRLKCGHPEDEVAPYTLWLFMFAKILHIPLLTGHKGHADVSLSTTTTKSSVRLKQSGGDTKHHFFFQVYSPTPPDFPPYPLLAPHLRGSHVLKMQNEEEPETMEEPQWPPPGPAITRPQGFMGKISMGKGPGDPNLNGKGKAREERRGDDDLLTPFFPVSLRTHEVKPLTMGPPCSTASLNLSNLILSSLAQPLSTPPSSPRPPTPPPPTDL
ncbi:hypothetical protein GWK47_032313 [Chionoecetes opilio]|uniref:Uncharacterized protein n=1 Tax=Chionoecetes opilio TaxID=41210 RepID=A0A8J5D3V8_CHIOP|nr:hypothetical protein GWK47_032313 [Chionoecetes opilio]